MSDLLNPPPLIEPVTLLIEAVNKMQTPYSTGVSGRRETVNHVVREQFSLPAQVVYGNQAQKMHSSLLGTDEQAAGYALFRLADMKVIGKEPKRGDRIVKINSVDLKQIMYFTHSVGDLASHFSSTGFTFTLLFFSDREPVG